MVTKLPLAYIKIGSDSTFFRSYQGSHIYIKDEASNFKWNYNLGGTVPGLPYYSFYQAFMHELGHILMVDHVNDPNDLMYYVINGPSYPLIADVNLNSYPVKGAKNNITASRDINWPKTGYTPSIHPPGALNAFFTVKNACYGVTNGSIATAAIGVPPLTYHWTGNGINATTKDISNLAAGTYFLELKDKNNRCIKNYTIIVPAVSGNSLSLNFTITGSNPQLYQANVTGGTPPYTYY